MHTAESIVNDLGQEYLDRLLMIYVNFYFSELDIIELCAKWIPRRKNLKEKFYLVKHANDEVRHAEMFREGVEKLGVTWNQELIDKYKISDIDDRFQNLLASEDELEILIGLNLYAEGVLAMEELEQLGTSMPEYFPDFLEIARDENAHFGYGKSVLRRMIKEDENERKRAIEYVEWYRNHLNGYLWGDISEDLSFGIEAGILTPDYRERTVARFERLVKSVGLAT